MHLSKLAKKVKISRLLKNGLFAPKMLVQLTTIESHFFVKSLLNHILKFYQLYNYMN